MNWVDVCPACGEGVREASTAQAYPVTAIPLYDYDDMWHCYECGADNLVDNAPDKCPICGADRPMQ